MKRTRDITRVGVKPAKRQPVRTCVGCRSRDAQSRLVRVAVADGVPVADVQRRVHGRGAYVHPRSECVDKATRRGGLARALRTRIDSDAGAALSAAALATLTDDSLGAVEGRTNGH